MIILPMLLTLVMGGTLSLIIIGIADIEPRSLNHDIIIYENKNNAREAINAGEYIFITDDISVYLTENNQYVMVLPDEADIPAFFTGYFILVQRYFVPALFMLFLLTIVYLTNRALTRFVFRGIITPIETLVSGVHEIRDGNLEYRIDYENNDEFSAVCAAFNEMARRLSDMVNQKQKDENSRRELIAGISHDLRSPLTVIKAYLEGIETGVASTPEAKQHYFDMIKNKTSDLEYIIKQLFLFSKLDIGDFPFHLEQIDIGRELNYFVNCHAIEYQEKGLAISLIKTFENDENIKNDENTENLYADIDVVQFRNVIYNILENSLKYKEHETAEVKIACNKDSGGYLKIILTDNGPGIPEEYLEKLFDVFYRNDASRNNPSQGSGLGLAISKKIIERLGGQIKAGNAPGGGLIIEITLPASKLEKLEKSKKTGNDINE